MKYLLPLFALILVGCSEEQFEHYDLEADQQLVQDVTNYLKKDEAIEKAVIVAAEDEWLVTYQLKPLDKWGKKKHESKVDEDVKNLLSPQKATVSNDFKLYHESKKLKEKKSDLKKVKKKIKELKKLKEEQT